MAPKHDIDEEITARRATAGKFGFILGCIAAAAAVAINLYRAPRPFTAPAVLLAVLMAALNIPLGIGIGLFGERVTRPEHLKPK
jgi:hypothetical protein